jgi:hypothetical protein
MIIRVYLFGLPFAALLGAGLVYGRPGGPPSMLRTGLIALAGSTLVVLFFVARYGNERMDLMTPLEVQAAQQTYQMAPPGSLLMSADTNLPWRFQGYEQYLCLPDTDILLVSDVHKLATSMRARGYANSYLLLTASEQAYAEMFFGLTDSDWSQFVASLRASPEFRLVYENADAQVFQLVTPTGTAVAP